MRKSSKVLHLIKYILTTFILSSFVCILLMETVYVNDDPKIDESRYSYDLNFLRNELPKLHPNLFDNINKNDYYSRLSKISKESNQMSVNDMRLEIMKLISDIGDGHTTVSIKTSKYYPITMKMIDDGSIRILESSKEYFDILSFKVIKINNVPINDVVKRIYDITPSESLEFQKSNIPYAITNYELMKLLKLTDSNGCLNLELKNLSGQTIKKSIKTIKKNDIHNIKYFSLINKYKNTPTKNINDNINYWYSVDNKNNIFYFDYNSCIDSKTAKYMGIDYSKYYVSMDKFFNDVVKSYDRCNVNSFVLDVRKNKGGNPKIIKSLISLLKSNEKFMNNSKHKNRIFILISNDTFSAGVLAAADFKKSFPNSTIIGTPTGGTTKVFSNSKVEVLTNTNMYLNYATNEYDHLDIGSSVLYPDINIDISLNDLLLNIDPCYEKVSSLSNNK